MTKNKSNNLVYSTDPDWQPKHDNIEPQKEPSTKTIYLFLDRKGRRGKNVTVIKGLSGNFKPILKELQRLCGSGGTVKDRQLEIQGSHREKIGKYLSDKGYAVKFSGG